MANPAWDRYLAAPSAGLKQYEEKMRQGALRNSIAQAIAEANSLGRSQQPDPGLEAMFGGGFGGPERVPMDMPQATSPPDMPPSPVGSSDAFRGVYPGGSYLPVSEMERILRSQSSPPNPSSPPRTALSQALRTEAIRGFPNPPSPDVRSEMRVTPGGWLGQGGQRNQMPMPPIDFGGGPVRTAVGGAPDIPGIPEASPVGGLVADSAPSQSMGGSSVLPGSGVLDSFYGNKGPLAYSLNEAVDAARQRNIDDRRFAPSPSAIARDAMVGREQALTQAMQAREQRDGLRFGSERPAPVDRGAEMIPGYPGQTPEQFDRSMHAAMDEGRRLMPRPGDSVIDGVNRADSLLAKYSSRPRSENPDLGDPAKRDAYHQRLLSQREERQGNAGALSRARKGIVPWNQDDQFMQAVMRSPAAMAAIIGSRGEDARNRLAMLMQLSQGEREERMGERSNARLETVARINAEAGRKTPEELALLDKWKRLDAGLPPDTGTPNVGMEDYLGQAGLSADPTPEEMDRVITGRPDLFNDKEIAAALEKYRLSQSNIWTSQTEKRRLAKIMKVYERAAKLRGLTGEVPTASARPVVELSPAAEVPARSYVPNSDGRLFNMGAPMGR